MGTTEGRVGIGDGLAIGWSRPTGASVAWRAPTDMAASGGACDNLAVHWRRVLVHAAGKIALVVCRNRPAWLAWG